MKLSNIPADELLKLFKYLEKFSKTENKKDFVKLQLPNFFKDLSLEQVIILNNIIDNEDKELCEKFIEKNSNIEFYPNGDNVKNNNLAIETKTKSLITLYNTLSNTEQSKLSYKQKSILLAFNIKNIMNIKVYDTIEVLLYKLRKITEYNKFIDFKYRINLDIEYFNENFLDFISKILTYSVKSKYKVYTLEYVLYILDIIRLTDKKSEFAINYLKNNSIEI